MFSLFSKPKTVDNVMSGFTQMVNDLEEVSNTEHQAAGKCACQITNLQIKMSDHKTEAKRADRLRRKLEEFMGE